MKALRGIVLIAALVFVAVSGFCQATITVTADNRHSFDVPNKKPGEGLTPLGHLFRDRSGAIWEQRGFGNYVMLVEGRLFSGDVRLVAGPGVVVKGTGKVGDPWIIESAPKKITLTQHPDGRWYLIEDKSDGRVLLSFPPQINIDTVWHEIKEVGRSRGYKILKNY